MRLLGFLVVGCVALAAAASPSAAQADRPCRDDIQRLCKDQTGAAVGKCLHDHLGELSPPCKERLEKVKDAIKQRGEAVKKACDSELKKYCSKGPAGPLRMVQCLREHEAELSPTCKAEVDKRPARHAGAAAAPGAKTTPAAGGPAGH